jgi:hypothetical protein
MQTDTQGLCVCCVLFPTERFDTTTARMRIHAVGKLPEDSVMWYCNAY